MINLSGGRMGIDIDFGNLLIDNQATTIIPVSFLPEIIYIQAKDYDNDKGKSIGIGKVGSNQCMYNIIDSDFTVKENKIYFCDNDTSTNIYGYISNMTKTSFTITSYKTLKVAQLFWIAIR